MSNLSYLCRRNQHVTNMRKPSAILSLIQRYSSLFSWISIYLVFYLSSTVHQSPQVAFLITNSAILPMIIVWALIQYRLAPRMLHQRRVMYYLLCGIILAVISIASTEIDLIIYTHLYYNGELRLPPEVELSIQRGESQRVFIHTKYVFLLLTTMAISTISWLLDERKRLNVQQREHRNRLELKYLRAQINPHFLFNALNCIYSLTLMQDEKAPDTVMKLSEMLRYVTDDCQSEFVPLHKEVDYIRNFIDFQKVRMEHPADIRFDIDVKNSSHMVPPMLFEPMVENCFKHSRIIDQPDGYIHLHLKQTASELRFTAQNSRPDLPQNQSKERSGVGIQNVRQRLELLFQDKATLDIQDTPSSYKVELCIKY